MGAGLRRLSRLITSRSVQWWEGRGNRGRGGTATGVRCELAAPGSSACEGAKEKEAHSLTPDERPEAGQPSSGRRGSPTEAAQGAPWDPLPYPTLLKGGRKKKREQQGARSKQTNSSTNINKRQTKGRTTQRERSELNGGWAKKWQLSHCAGGGVSHSSQLTTGLVVNSSITTNSHLGRWVYASSSKGKYSVETIVIL